MYTTQQDISKGQVVFRRFNAEMLHILSHQTPKCSHPYTWINKKRFILAPGDRTSAHQEVIRAALITLNYTTGRFKHISLHSSESFTARSKQHILLLAP